jgi:hypothetical protein
MGSFLGSFWVRFFWSPFVFNTKWVRSVIFDYFLAGRAGALTQERAFDEYAAGGEKSRRLRAHVNAPVDFAPGRQR